MIQNVLIILSLYFLVFTIPEIIYRKFNIPFLIARKIAHIAGAIVSALLPVFVSSNIALIISLIFVFVAVLSRKKKIFKSVHNGGVVGSGEVVFPLGVILAILIIWPISTIAFQGACLVLGFSDALAGYIGRRYGKREFMFLKGGKTILGSSMFFLSTVVIFLIYYFFYSSFSILGLFLVFIFAFIITSLEAIFYNGWDNLIIPIGAGAALFFLT
jgi:phytol kinase